MHLPLTMGDDGANYDDARRAHVTNQRAKSRAVSMSRPTTDANTRKHEKALGGFVHALRFERYLPDAPTGSACGRAPADRPCGPAPGRRATAARCGQRTSSRRIWDWMRSELMCDLILQTRARNCGITRLRQFCTIIICAVIKNTPRDHAVPLASGARSAGDFVLHSSAKRCDAHVLTFSLSLSHAVLGALNTRWPTCTYVAIRSPLLIHS